MEYLETTPVLSIDDRLIHGELLHFTNIDMRPTSVGAYIALLKHNEALRVYLRGRFGAPNIVEGGEYNEQTGLIKPTDTGKVGIYITMEAFVNQI